MLISSTSTSACPEPSFTNSESFATSLKGPPYFRDIAEQARREGLWVLPACADPAEKHPCIDWADWDGPPTDEHNAEWLKIYPRRNGVYLTGPGPRRLGRFVLDADSIDAVEWIEVRGGCDEAQIVRSTRGFHYHFAYPDFHVWNSAGKIHEGCDIRGDGGTAVAAGSVGFTGHVYPEVPSRRRNKCLI